MYVIEDICIGFRRFSLLPLYPEPNENKQNILILFPSE